MNDRAKALSEQIKADPKSGGVALPKPEWKGWTLGQEMASFDAERERQAIIDSEHGFDTYALGYYVNPSL